MSNKTELQTIIEDHNNWEDTKDKLNKLNEEYNNFFKAFKKQLFNWKLNVLIILIVAMIIGFWYMFGGAGYCQHDPFDYGANRIASSKDGNVKCNCFFYSNEKKLTRLRMEQPQVVMFSFKNKDFGDSYLSLRTTNLTSGDMFT